MALLHLENLTFGFPNKKLGTINLRIEQPEIIGLKGLNGSGKSTLLRTISGHLAPLEGSVFIQEKNIHTLSPIAAATLVSIIFTRRPQVFGITARELIEMGRFAQHQKRKDPLHDEALLAMIARELKLEALLPRMIDTLSDGEMQRVLIALALTQETPIILMDEPTAFLDYQAKEDFYFLLKKLKSDFQKIIIFSSHDLQLMERVADRMQNLEVGSRKLEVGSWKSEVGSWKLEVGSWKLEVGSWKSEVGSWRLEVGSWRLEVGSWKLEVGGWKLEVGSWKFPKLQTPISNIQYPISNIQIL